MLCCQVYMKALRSLFITGSDVINSQAVPFGSYQKGSLSFFLFFFPKAISLERKYTEFSSQDDPF